MTIAYAVRNQIAALAPADFTFAGGASDSTRGYLNDGLMDKQWISGTPATTTTCIVDMGSAVSLYAWAFLNTNIAEAGSPTLKIEAADNAGMSTNLITFKATTSLNQIAPRHRDHILQGALTAAKRYWRFTWTFSSNFVLRIGEIYASVASFLLSRTGVYGGSGDGETFITAQSELQYGTTKSLYLGGPVRETHLKWDDHSAADKEELATLWRATKGPVTPFLWIPTYDNAATAASNDQQEVIFGNLMRSDFYAPQSDFNLYQPPEFLIRSLGRGVGQ